MVEIPVRLGPRSYRILVGTGLHAGIGSELVRLKVGRKVALVTDSSIQALHGETVSRSLAEAGFDVTRVLLPEGEAAKTLEVAASTWDRFLEAGLDRTSTVVALGGGAVGDLAGFTAATYMRGVNFVQVPTTLLAQVDASIGGKTAIDHARAKNLIGAFYQPRLVIADTAALLTLPEREYRSGMAEVIKHGIVLDAAYFAEVERGAAALRAREPATLEAIVAGSCRLKASVVERDEQEAELRHVLNYGHTIGHAVEAITGYQRFAHGEAVSLGIAAEAAIAERLGLAGPATRARQVAALEAVGLPVRGVGEPPERVVEALSRDKKAKDGRVPFVLAPEIGAFRLVYDVPRGTILDALADLG
ncbi:MAG TPA: 3-dehydroquinate synthase [Candidatus Bathyarchaeia archaeon]|nr:3-dehydroquinate synthase [Candidatus Bathyarchaeia archaeon]